LNLRRILNLGAAFAAVAAAAAVCVVAASFALYAVVKPWLGEAGAAAVVAGAFALVAVVVAWLATRKAAPKKPAKAAEASTVDRLIDLAKDKPVIALGAAVAASAAAAFVAVRNPAVLSAVLAAFLAREGSKPEK
jgi:hypothetical protein